MRLELPEGDLRGVIDAVVVSNIDDSGSMFCAWGDVAGVRYAAARSIADLMRRMGGGRFGVVHWGSGTPADLVLPPTSVRHKKLIDDALRAPRELGGTNVAASLHRCRELLPADSRRPVIFTLTDGIQPVGPDVIATLEQLPPKCVHVLLVDRSNGCVGEVEAAWRALPLGSFTRLNVVDVGEMATQMAKILAHAIGLTTTNLATV